MSIIALGEDLWDQIWDDEGEKTQEHPDSSGFVEMVKEEQSEQMNMEEC